jgi:hypothetical protein
MAYQQQPQTGAAMLLARQLKLMQNQDHIPGISVGLVDDGNVFDWEVMLMINDDCKFYGGMCALTPRYEVEGCILITTFRMSRWIFQSAPFIPPAVSAPPTSYEIRDANMASQQSVSSFPLSTQPY